MRTLRRGEPVVHLEKIRTQFGDALVDTHEVDARAALRVRVDEKRPRHLRESLRQHRRMRRGVGDENCANCGEHSCTQRRVSPDIRGHTLEPLGSCDLLTEEEAE